VSDRLQSTFLVQSSAFASASRIEASASTNIDMKKVFNTKETSDQDIQLKYQT
jgi:hypothetical protein